MTDEMAETERIRARRRIARNALVGQSADAIATTGDDTNAILEFKSDQTFAMQINGETLNVPVRYRDELHRLVDALAHNCRSDAAGCADRLVKQIQVDPQLRH